MTETEDFVADCVASVTADPEAAAAKVVVERAVRNKHLAEELAREDGVRVLHCDERLTILHVMMPKRPVGFGDPIPHNHRLWAVIGVTHGAEANEFFRRGADTIESSGGRVLHEGDVLVLDEDMIHAVKNPSSELPSSALHVYGGNLIASTKAMWCEPDRSEQPFDLGRVIGS